MRGYLCLAFFLISFQVSAVHAFDKPPVVGSGFGVQIKAEDAGAETLSRIKDLGFGYVRFSLGWHGLEPEKGRYDWRESDRLIAAVRAAGLKMVIPVLGGHRLYDGMVAAPLRNVDHVKMRTRAPGSPETVDAYARLMAHAALRYGSEDIVWEIWNEPDLARFWPPSADADAFAALAEATCLKARQVRPHAVMIGPALGRVPDTRDKVTPAFLRRFLASRAASCVDGVSVHLYRHGREEPEAVFGDYETLYDLMVQYRNVKPLLNTEIGYTTVQVPPEMQSSYVMRTRLLDMLWGVPLTIWYEWRDSRDDPTDPEARFGLVTQEGAAKPSLEAVESLLPEIKEMTLERQVHTSDPRDLLLFLRQPEGEGALVGWSLRSETETPVVVEVTIDGKAQRIELTGTPSLLARGADLGEIVLSEGKVRP